MHKQTIWLNITSVTWKIASLIIFTNFAIMCYTSQAYQAYRLLSPCIKIASTIINRFGKLNFEPTQLRANPCTSNGSWYLGIPVSPCIHCIKTILTFNICAPELLGVSSVSPIITMYQDCINEYQTFSRKPTKF